MSIEGAFGGRKGIVGSLEDKTEKKQRNQLNEGRDGRGLSMTQGWSEVGWECRWVTGKVGSRRTWGANQRAKSVSPTEHGSFVLLRFSTITH